MRKLPAPVSVPMSTCTHAPIHPYSTTHPIVHRQSALSNLAGTSKLSIATPTPFLPPSPLAIPRRYNLRCLSAMWAYLWTACEKLAVHDRIHCNGTNFIQNDLATFEMSRGTTDNKLEKTIEYIGTVGPVGAICRC